MIALALALAAAAQAAAQLAEPAASAQSGPAEMLELRLVEAGSRVPLCEAELRLCTRVYPASEGPRLLAGPFTSDGLGRVRFERPSEDVLLVARWLDLGLTTALAHAIPAGSVFELAPLGQLLPPTDAGPGFARPRFELASWETAEHRSLEPGIDPRAWLRWSPEGEARLWIREAEVRELRELRITRADLAQLPLKLEPSPIARGTRILRLEGPPELLRGVELRYRAHVPALRWQGPLRGEFDWTEARADEGSIFALRGVPLEQELELEISCATQLHERVRRSLPAVGALAPSADAVLDLAPRLRVALRALDSAGAPLCNANLAVTRIATASRDPSCRRREDALAYRRSGSSMLRSDEQGRVEIPVGDWDPRAPLPLELHCGALSAQALVEAPSAQGCIELGALCFEPPQPRVRGLVRTPDEDAAGGLVVAQRVEPAGRGADLRWDIWSAADDCEFHLRGLGTDAWSVRVLDARGASCAPIAVREPREILLDWLDPGAFAIELLGPEPRPLSFDCGFEVWGSSTQASERCWRRRSAAEVGSRFEFYLPAEGPAEQQLRVLDASSGELCWEARVAPLAERLRRVEIDLSPRALRRPLEISGPANRRPQLEIRSAGRATPRPCFPRDALRAEEAQAELLLDAPGYAPLRLAAQPAQQPAPPPLELQPCPRVRLRAARDLPRPAGGLELALCLEPAEPLPPAAREWPAAAALELRRFALELDLFVDVPNAGRYRAFFELRDPARQRAQRVAPRGAALVTTEGERLELALDAAALAAAELALQSDAADAGERATSAPAAVRPAEPAPR